MSVSTSEIKLTKTEAGVIRIGDTRVSLDSVIIAFNQGSAPEEIVYSYDSLTLSEVDATISCYLQNQKEVDSYLAQRDKQNNALRESVEARFNHTGIRERLLSRRGKAEKLSDLFAPVREQIKESGVSNNELTELLEESRKEVFQEKLR